MTETKNVTTAETTVDPREFFFRALVEILRRRSAEGLLSTKEELQTELTGLGVPVPTGDDPAAGPEALFSETLQSGEEIRTTVGVDGVPRYSHRQAMTETYARLLLRKEEGPLQLIAETVRENSKLYPRPVSLGLFTDPPFDMAPDEVLSCIQRMAGLEEYGDIAQTTTSMGSVFLFSKRHLEPGYASYLAEWLDVGQANNP
jgi:hypothetical protein